MRAWLLFALAPALLAHETITTKLVWTQEISRIIYRHCANCHRDGGFAMSLMTYDEARPWAKAIRDEVLSRRMPPWGAMKGVGEFRADPSLSQIEIDMIVNWVEGGAPKGDDAYLPPAPRLTPAPAPPSSSGQLSLSTEQPATLRAATEVLGLRPVHLPPGESLEVIAQRPDGGVDRLIWIRNWHTEWQRTYYFRHALHFPKGTRLAAFSAKPAQVELLLARNDSITK